MQIILLSLWEYCAPNKVYLIRIYQKQQSAAALINSKANVEMRALFGHDL